MRNIMKLANHCEMNHDNKKVQKAGWLIWNIFQQLQTLKELLEW